MQTIIRKNPISRAVADGRPLPDKIVPVKLFRIILILVISLCIIFSGPASAQEKGVSENRVKSAFLYYFVKFVDWPQKVFTDSDGSIALCIIGDSPLIDDLWTIQGKKVNGRIINIERHVQPDEIGECNLLFICKSEKNRLEEIFNKLDGKSVLTVSDMGSFVENRGMIELVVFDNKIRFHINLAVANRAGLSISSQLLKLAKKVIQ